MINSITTYIEANTSESGAQTVYSNLAKYTLECFGADTRVMNVIDDHKLLFTCIFDLLNDDSQHAVSHAIRRQVSMAA